jgi:hypothetical protein
MCCFLEENCPKFEFENSSEKLSAETDIHKIDSWERPGCEKADMALPGCEYELQDPICVSGFCDGGFWLPSSFCENPLDCCCQRLPAWLGGGPEVEHRLLVKSSVAGLPDFFWYNIPKWEKYTKLPQNISNGHEIYKITVK